MSAAIHRVTVIVPMRNEAEHVAAFVDDVARQDYEGEIELLVADGGSDDGSPALLREAARRAGLALRVLDNPAGLVSSGLNACIAQASGQLIVRLDCHSRYPADYVRLCACAAQETGAWNVGGRVRPEGRAPMQRAVACAMDSPFGGIGWTRAAASGSRSEVDTVTFGAFRPEAFACAGLFDETLVRNQDDEFNMRLRRAGGRIVLDPQIVVRYLPRRSLRAVWRQYHAYGLWKVPVMRKHGRLASARSLAPVALTLSLAILAPAATVLTPARALLAAELGAYAAATTAFGGRAVRARGEPAWLLALVAAVFPTFHLAYGTGMMRGLLRGAPAVAARAAAAPGG